MKLTLAANPNHLTTPLQKVVFSGRLTTLVGGVTKGVPKTKAYVSYLHNVPIEGDVYWPVGFTWTRGDGSYTLKPVPGHRGRYIAHAVDLQHTVIARSKVIKVS